MQKSSISHTYFLSAMPSQTSIWTALPMLTGRHCLALFANFLPSYHSTDKTCQLLSINYAFNLAIQASVFIQWPLGY